MTVDPDDTRWLDATAHAELVTSGEAAPAELVEAAVRRAETLNPTLNAIIHPNYDEAIEEAADPPGGLLRGAPFAFKDLVAHETGRPFHEGSRFLKEIGHTARTDQAYVERAKGAGLVSIGRTNTPEFGMRPACEPLAYGPTHNPWRGDHSPGGSSGGSAAAVASGIVPIAHANDVGGSIRNPASFCGLVGLKPSRARVTLAPDFGDVMLGLAEELVLCRTVRDAALALDVLAGPGVGDWMASWPRPVSYVADLDGDLPALRVGVLTGRFPARFGPHDGLDVDDGVAAVVAAAASALEELGHDVVAEVPEALAEEIGSFVLPHYAAGTAWVIDHHWPRVLGRPVPADLVEPITGVLAEMGRALDSGTLLDAHELAQLWVRRLLAWWQVDGFDLLVLPTVVCTAPRHGTTDDLALLATNGPFNVSGQPAISLPLGESDGMPVGVQLVADHGREDVLLRVARQLEQAMPWADRHPSDAAG